MNNIQHHMTYNHNPKMSSTAPTTFSPTTLTTLPGELRNEIFNLCITQALTHPQYRSTSPFTGTVFSRHPNTGYLKLSHVVNPLPLVLVNRQTCIEVFSLLYARVERIELGDGVSVWLDDDAVERFNFAYQILERAGCVMKMVKSIEIVLPRTPCFQHVKTYAALMKMELKKGERKSSAVGILRGLDVFLRRFGRLESVKIVLTAELKDWPPAYEEFLGVWGVVGGNLTVDYKTRMNQWGTGGRASAVDMMHRDWRAWKDRWERYVQELEQIGREEVEDKRFKESS
ncbi:hypothetical protein L207DRAFT_520610 [Hyaloscypha variabilis F]|uniref:Uncharacterized protein n=1 Tax=Hyaloscypha variabilis (strain UAMH 11265 / GT02V1 / F) TaxID=1149755 RepID=A0A2J6QUN7_HYAVF|nr:hypothetical protein L207DRAFT_520610 [Hyaloscypha variabilis F]